MLHTVIFIGRSGCGKGTQVALFKESLNRADPEKRPILYVETGDRFRAFVRDSSYSSRLAREVNDTGGLQPEFLAAWMWGNVLVEELDENMHLIFDGVARALDEAKILTTALKFYKRERVTVVYLNVSKRWAEERLLARGRQDDATLKKIDARQTWFERQVVPAIEYFKSEPFYRVLEINGEQPIEKVHADLITAYEYKNKDVLE